MNCLKCGSVLSEDKCGKCGFDLTSESFVFVHTKKDAKVRLKKYAAMYEEIDKGYEDIIMAVEDGEYIGNLLKNKSNKEKREVFEHFRREAEQGNAMAQLVLGEMYRVHGTEWESDEKATEWYRLAAEQGYARAQYKLGQHLIFGQYYSRDRATSFKREIKQEGIKWIRKAAEKGLADAQYSLGFRYEIDESDDLEAVKWYRLAAKQKHIKAMFQLGIHYMAGKGSPQDYKKAVECFKFVYNHEDEASCFDLGKAGIYLGDLYMNGWGVEQDYNEAMNWYRYAAETAGIDRGTIRSARTKIGEMFRDGHGVPKSYMQYLKCKKCAKQKWPIKNCTVSCKSTHL